MAIQRLTRDDATILESPGLRSEQILWPRNAPDAQVTITRVTLAPGAESKRHAHAAAEQTWLVERGAASLLTALGAAGTLRPGDVVRTPAGEVHGVANPGPEPFVYLSITTPAVDFTSAYRSERPAG